MCIHIRLYKFPKDDILIAESSIRAHNIRYQTSFDSMPTTITIIIGGVAPRGVVARVKNTTQSSKANCGGETMAMAMVMHYSYIVGLFEYRKKRAMLQTPWFLVSGFRYSVFGIWYSLFGFRFSVFCLYITINCCFPRTGNEKGGP